MRAGKLPNWKQPAQNLRLIAPWHSLLRRFATSLTTMAPTSRSALGSMTEAFAASAPLQA